MSSALHAASSVARSAWLIGAGWLAAVVLLGLFTWDVVACELLLDVVLGFWCDGLCGAGAGLAGCGVCAAADMLVATVFETGGAAGAL